MKLPFVNAKPIRLIELYGLMNCLKTKTRRYRNERMS